MSFTVNAGQFTPRLLPTQVWNSYTGTMRTTSIAFGSLLLAAVQGRIYSPQTPGENNQPKLTVMLLGTSGGPQIHAEGLGIATLVVAGTEKLLFDCGRSVTTGMARLGVPASEITKVFLTHLHSVHIVGIPELYLFP